MRSASSATTSTHSFFDTAALGQLGSGVSRGAVRRASATSDGRGGRATPNCFDAVGEIRMEAFVEGASEEDERGMREEEYDGRQRSLGGRAHGIGNGSGSFRGGAGGSLPGRGSEIVQLKRGGGSLQASRPMRKDLRYWGVEVPGASVGEGPVRGKGAGTGWGEVNDPFEGF